MKNIQKHFAVALISISTMVFISCNSNSNKSNNSNSDNSERNTTIQKEEPKEESVDGLYTYEDNSTKLSIRVSGSSWSGKTLIVSGFGEEYDNQNAQYDNGIIKGKELFENSGMVKIGYISGNSLTTSIGGQTVTLRK
jgi:hypothetical protein